jgi:hypothetical protein
MEVLNERQRERDAKRNPNQMWKPARGISSGPDDLHEPAERIAQAHNARDRFSANPTQ